MIFKPIKDAKKEYKWIADDKDMWKKERYKIWVRPIQSLRGLNGRGHF